MKRLLSLLTTWSVMAVALMALLITGSDTAEAHFFTPTATLTPSNTAAGANSDLSSTFGVAAPNYNFGAVIAFTPPEWGVAADADIPDGAPVGELSALATLGLLNNSCDGVVAPSFELLDGTTDFNNPISPNDPGTPDRLSPLSLDDNGNGIIDGAEKFPSFLGPPTASNPDALFSKAALSDLHARLIGFDTQTVSGLTIVLNFMIFEPGTQISEDFVIDPALGFPSVTVLLDPTQTASNEDPITDFCSPLTSATTLLGEAGGDPFRTNPPDGAYNFVTFTASLLDADLDGIENALDPCPFDRDDQYGPNGDIAWDPRGAKNQNPGDRDVNPDNGKPFGDGIPDSCDPFPDVPSTGSSGIGIGLSDEDGDLWANRVDNCPLVPNPDQKNSDSDSIGDACDPNPNDNDGHFHVECLVSTVTIGSGGSAPPAPNLCNENAVGIDLDVDGVFDSLDNCPPPENATASELEAAANPGQEDADGDGIGDACDTDTTTTLTATDDTGVAGVAGETTGPTGTGAAGGAATGVGSLAPAIASIPAWAAAASALGGAGLLGSLGALASRILRRRRQ